MRTQQVAGVYCWLCIVTRKRYVGSGGGPGGIKRRKRDHLTALRAGEHWNPYFQAAWNKHGEKNFRFVILQRCHPDDCVKQEQKWMDHYKSWDRRYGYNISPTAGSNKGVRASSETRRKLSESHIGNGHTEHTKRSISKTMRLRRANGWVFSKGWKLSKKSRENQRQGALGRTDLRGKTYEEIYGPKRAAEIRAKASKKLRGRPFSKEHRRKLSEAAYARYA